MPSYCFEAVTQYSWDLNPSSRDPRAPIFFLAGTRALRLVLGGTQGPRIPSHLHPPVGDLRTLGASGHVRLL